MSVIDEVKQRTDIVEVISQYTTLTKAGRTFRALCPFHSEKHPSFYVYPEQQSWHCFGACNTGGDVFSFIMKKDGIGFSDALHLLADRAGVVIPSRLDPEAGKGERERLYQINDAAAKYFHDLLLNSPKAESTRNYVASRGLSEETINNFQLGFSLNDWEALKQHLMAIGYSEDELKNGGLIVESDDGKTHDRFRNRLMFPILDSRSRVTGFGARALDNSEPKYLNSPQTPVFDKSNTLYGINLAAPAIRQQDLAVIVEGYMDVITTHQNGFNNVIASMGTSVTDRQISTIKKVTPNIALALDADTAGEEAMLRCISYENQLNTEVKVIIMPEGRDPDDVIRGDPQAWQHMLAEALPLVDYTFNMVTTKLDLNTAAGKSLATNKLLPIIAEMKDPVRQAHYIQKLARLVNVSEKSIDNAMGRIKSSKSQYQSPSINQEAAPSNSHSLFSSPIEEYYLTLLLQHPELKEKCRIVPLEYFENSENREILSVWQQAEEPSLIKEQLDPTIHEHLEALMNKSLKFTSPATPEKALDDCSLRLEERYLRLLEMKKATILALEAELGGTEAELAKLEEQGKEVSIQLGRVFSQRAERNQSKRR